MSYNNSQSISREDINSKLALKLVLKSIFNMFDALEKTIKLNLKS